MFKSKYLRAISVLTSGSIIAQIITVIAAPFITRLYSPEEIGIYTFVIAISHLFMGVINGRYDMAIVIEKNEKKVYPLVKVSILIAVFSSIIISIGYGLYIFYVNKEYSSYFYTVFYLFALLISYGLINVFTAYNNRKKEYKLMASVYMIRTLIQNAGGIILGIFFKLGMLGLLIPYALGQYMGLFRQAKSIFPFLKDIRKSTKQEMQIVMKDHIRQPLYSVPALFANSFSYASITFFIASLFGMSTVGFYSISVRLLGLPLAIISGNVSKVFFERASREYDDSGSFYESLKKTAMFQFVLAVPMVIFMIIFAPKIFEIIFGEGWATAGNYIAILAPMFGLRFIVSAVSPGLIIANKQNYELILQLLFICASSLSFIISKMYALTVEDFLILITFTFSLCFIIFFLVLVYASKKKK